MKTTGEWTADVIILVLMTGYACYASCHIAVMWKLRKNFLIALRYARKVGAAFGRDSFPCATLTLTGRFFGRLEDYTTTCCIGGLLEVQQQGISGPRSASPTLALSERAPALGFALGIHLSAVGFHCT